MSNFLAIPTVDLLGLATQPPVRADDTQLATLAEQVTSVCHQVGFMVIVNHGVDERLISDVFGLMDRFFTLPFEHKALIDKTQSPHFRGWENVGSEQTNNQPDIREQIDLWSEWPTVDALEPTYFRLLGPNQWMPEDLLPGGKAIMDEWFETLGGLADQVLRLLSVGLGLDAEHLFDYFGDQPMSLTKLINYPRTPPGQAGVNAHHDTGFLTLLAAGRTPGLQVQNPVGEWIDVPPIDGGLVVNIGEMLQAMTGNYLVATPHRVITNEPRRSAGYFHGPSLEARLDPLPLDPRFAAAVAASPHHNEAGYMAGRDETARGTPAMQGERSATTYGEQLWNYFSRSYPELMTRHHGARSN